MINGILHAGQGVLPYMGAMLTLGVRVAKTTVADVQTVPVFGPVVSIKVLR